MHLDDERLQRLLDGELSPVEEGAAREHVAGCAECRDALIGAKQEERDALALMRALDQATPRLDVETIETLARDRHSSAESDVEIPQPIEPLTVGRIAKRRPMRARWVAALAAALAVAGAAYAIPGSPLPAWVRSVVGLIRAERSPVGPGRPPSIEDSAGIAVTPGASMLIEFRTQHAEGKAIVTLTDGSELVIRAPLGAASFVSDVDRVVVSIASNVAGFEIQVPRAAPRVEMRIEDVPVFLKVRSQVTLADQTAADQYRFSLKP